MQCLTPLTLYRTEGHRIGKDYRTDVVGCGKCPSCLRSRQAAWCFRLKEEQRISTSSAFLTLTYEDGKLPYSENGLMTLDVRDHQLFMKRLRKTVKTHFPNAKKPIKYYMCGEYGELFFRPHFHSLIFNLPKEYLQHPELIERDWQKGFVDVGQVETRSIAYVTGYMHKTLYHTNQDPHDDRRKEFSTMSKGIGSSYLTPNRLDYYRRKLEPYLVIEEGQKMQIPRYYKDKMFSDPQKAVLNLKAKEHIDLNPTWTTEKQRADYIEQQFKRWKYNQLLKRKTNFKTQKDGKEENHN